MWDVACMAHTLSGPLDQIHDCAGMASALDLRLLAVSAFLFAAVAAFAFFKAMRPQRSLALLISNRTHLVFLSSQFQQVLRMSPALFVGGITQVMSSWMHRLH